MSERGRPRLSGSTYARLAARNLWRQPRRTLLTLTALIVGIAAMTLLGALHEGFMNNMRDNFILSYKTHLQIHARGYEETRQVERAMREPAPALAYLATRPEVVAASERLTVSGLAAVARAATAVNIVGVDPEREARATKLKQFVIAGTWFPAGDARALLLGARLVERLDIELGDKVILTAQNPAGDIVAEVFHLRGVLQSSAPEIDYAAALIPLASARALLDMPGATEIVVRVGDIAQVDSVYAGARAALPADEFEILRWWELDPLVKQQLEFNAAYAFVVILVVIMVAVAQILNTLLMSLQERLREFGLMAALGTQRWQLGRMLLWESLVLVTLGAVIGYGIGALAALYFAHVGIDLSMFSNVMRFFYMDTVLYPQLTAALSGRIVGATAIATVLVSLYPAWRAARLDPVAAMRRL